jgi:hypothetical protein
MFLNSLIFSDAVRQETAANTIRERKGSRPTKISLRMKKRRTIFGEKSRFMKVRRISVSGLWQLRNAINFSY